MRQKNQNPGQVVVGNDVSKFFGTRDILDENVSCLPAVFDGEVISNAGSFGETTPKEEGRRYRPQSQRPSRDAGVPPTGRPRSRRDIIASLALLFAAADRYDDTTSLML